ncbi:MAG: hypothetical protein E4G90_00165 [Gemmatimonadales bacterium]|nr:MAG: hypothetical protein E4G90_00165 [Gemmatimonadales bacterium]
MTQEPEYLKRLRAKQARQGTGDAPGSGSKPKAAGTLSVQEQEAVRWAREIAETELRSIKDLVGAPYCVVIRVQSATGEMLYSIEGLKNREALVKRLMPDAGLGEEILGSYEVRGGRPITTEVVDNALKLRMGEPRPGANPISPEKMLRQATSQAAIRAKSQPRGDRDR